MQAVAESESTITLLDAREGVRPGTGTKGNFSELLDWDRKSENLVFQDVYRPGRCRSSSSGIPLQQQHLQPP